MSEGWHIRLEDRDGRLVPEAKYDKNLWNDEDAERVSVDLATAERLELLKEHTEEV